jgi:hypothetical protein
VFSVTTSGAERQDFYEQIPVIIRELLYRLNDNDVSVLKANHAAFSAISKHVPAEELVKHVEFMRNLLASMVSDARRRKGGVGDGEFLLPGFNMPKGTYLQRHRVASFQVDERNYYLTRLLSWGFD